MMENPFLSFTLAFHSIHTTTTTTKHIMYHDVGKMCMKALNTMCPYEL